MKTKKQMFTVAYMLLQEKACCFAIVLQDLLYMLLKLLLAQIDTYLFSVKMMLLHFLRGNNRTITPNPLSFAVQAVQ